MKKYVKASSSTRPQYEILGIASYLSTAADLIEEKMDELKVIMNAVQSPMSYYFTKDELDAIDDTVQAFRDFYQSAYYEVHPVNATTDVDASTSPTGYYRISYYKNGVYQAILVKADSTEEAIDKFVATKCTDAIGCSPVNDSELETCKKKDMPIMKEAD